MSAPRSRSLYRLTHMRAVKLKLPGIYEDGGGLRLVVSRTLSKRWVMRLTINGRRCERGLGGFPTVSLEAARERAAELRKAARQNRDLVREEKRQRTMRTMTFAAAFETYFQHKRRTLANPKHAAQWRSTMERYVLPKIGALPVAEIDAERILAVLTPIWFDKPETARRVLQRMEAVFRSAILRGARKLASPCIGVAEELGCRHRTVRHHASLPWREVPEFLKRLHLRKTARVTQLSLEFLILTAARSGEVRGARWSEMDLDAREWRIPGQRMKAGAPHTVPLSDRCLAILTEVRALCPQSELVFPSRRSRQLSDMAFTKLLRDMGYGGRATAHGFRTSFKVWAAEVAKVRDEVSEAALAHRIAEKVRAAYLRTSFLGERRQLMQCWASHVIGSAPAPRLRRRAATAALEHGIEADAGLD
ncbi:MAG TPA: tyrosine-type recombinase/integrase [Hyphomicrobiaceae bacterium]|nr:tyrosine-type recombinase/integrase [Hyphomicrobiaceae bacterium]